MCTSITVTILDVARSRGIKSEKDGKIPGSEFDRVGLPMIGGCQHCGATIAAYNAYPSKTGFLQCSDCIADIGFGSVEAFEEFANSEYGQM